MAEHLGSIFGTEKDRVNCPFYFKIGSCRHGDRCSRLHTKPSISPTLPLSNMYQRFGTEKDRVNCPFYFKIGSCRHGDRCSRLHTKPSISPTLPLSNMYQRPDMITPGVDPQGQPSTPRKSNTTSRRESGFAMAATTVTRERRKKWEPISLSLTDPPSCPAKKRVGFSVPDSCAQKKLIVTASLCFAGDSAPRGLSFCAVINSLKPHRKDCQ